MPERISPNQYGESGTSPESDVVRRVRSFQPVKRKTLMARKWTKTAGILFMAASAVYSGQFIIAGTNNATNSNGTNAAATPANTPAQPRAAADVNAKAAKPAD